MRRAIVTIGGTAAGLAALLAFKTHPIGYLASSTSGGTSSATPGASPGGAGGLGAATSASPSPPMKRMGARGSGKGIGNARAAPPPGARKLIDGATRSLPISVLVLLFQRAQRADEELAVGRAEAGHVVAALPRDLPGAALRSVVALHVENGQTLRTAVGRRARRRPVERRGDRGERQDVAERIPGRSHGSFGVAIVASVCGLGRPFLRARLT